MEQDLPQEPFPDVIGLDTEAPRESALTRWAWSALLAAPLVAVFAGLAALAALSRGVVVGRDGLARLEYSRLDRFAAPTTLRVQVSPAAEKNGALKLLLSYGYINAVRVRSVYPAPKRVEAAKDGVVFTFPAQGPKRPTTVVFQVEGIAYGALDGELEVAGGPALPFKQYLLP